MTEPTDAEIEALGHRMCWHYKHDTGVNHVSTWKFNAQTLHDFARAVLAKWGQPTHSGEPVAWYEYNGDLDAWFLAYSHNPKAKTRPLAFGDAAPRAIEAEVRKEDEALIRQLVDALEQSQPYVESCANGKRVQGWGEQLDRAQDAINAARSRLEQPSGPAASRGVAFFMVTSAHPSQLHTACSRPKGKSLFFLRALPRK